MPPDVPRLRDGATVGAMKLRAPVAFALLATMAAIPSCQREEASTARDGASATAKGGTAMPAAAAGAPQLELFVMSQCPYGVEVVNAAAAAKEKLGAAMDVKIQYIGDGKPGALQSMHGPAEVTGDLAQVCAMKQAPQQILSFITCQNKNPREVDKNWRDCATKNSIDPAALEKCIQGDEGQKLLTASFDEAKKRGAQGSPTMFLAGKPYEGGRKPRDFMRAVCEATKGEKPAACTSLPVAPKVSAIFFSDTRCKECDIHQLEPRLRSELSGLVVKHVDYASDEGKALYKELTGAGADFKTLPTVLLGQEVENDKDGYAAISRYLRKVGDYQELRLGGQWDPTAEICDNKSDDDGDGKVDCSDDGCGQSLGCRPTREKKLDLFVMSQCPYGAQAMIAAKEFTDHFKGQVSLDVHFIGDTKDGQLSSMHGPAEVDEDVRETCAAKLYGKDHQFLGYLACRSKDYRSTDWQGCAKEAGMDTSAIQKCFDGEGKQLVAQSFAYADSLKIGSSPTFLVNNKRDFNAVSASAIQREYCKDNPGLAACKDIIPEAAAPPGAAKGAQAPAGQCN